MGLIFRLLRLLGLLFTLLLAGVIAIAGYVLVAGAGSPPPCASEAGSTLQTASKSLAFDARLSGFVLAGGRAPLTSVSFDESEAASRAAVYLDSHVSRVSGVAVCFEDGSAQGFLRIDTGIGRKLGVSAKGALDLSGEHPRLRLSSARVAGVGLPGIVRGRLEDEANRYLADVAVGFPMVLSFTPDHVVLARHP